MKRSITGCGGPPRKLSAILLSAVMLVTGLALASDNSIYIDQAGDNATIAITQDGTTNVVRGIQGTGSGDTTPAKIYGDGNEVSVTQTGANSVLNLGINRGTGTGTTGNSVTYDVTGNNATATLNLNNADTGTAASNTVGISQSGNYATSDLSVTGDSNTISVTTAGGANNAYTSTVAGDSNTQSISMTGGASNSATVSQSGDSNSAVITAVGASNTFGITQSDGAHTTSIGVAGSSNTFSVTQQGTAGANTFNYTSTSGSGNTVTINQNAR